MYRLPKKTNKTSVKRKEITENGIGSNYRTIDPKPIDFFHDARVEVDMYPTAWGKYGVEVTCPELKYDSGLRAFSDEGQATLFARNTYSDLISKLNAENKMLEMVLKRILEDTSCE